jgi:predicted Zn finger-like uncharacterized protein
MPTMQTQCPACNTIFKVSKSQLAKADGLVRCGQCQYIFNGRDQLQGAKASQSSAENDTPEMLRHILLGRRKPSRGATVGWSAAIVIGVLGLLLQLAYLQRDRLADHPQAGPIVVDICKRIPGCELAPKRDLSQLQLVSRNVYSHPNIESALMINAVIVNAANFSQPFPVLLVSMSDVHGKVVAERYFHPAEYLPEKPEAADMQPGKAISVNLEVMDPGQNALAFELDFL